MKLLRAIHFDQSDTHVYDKASEVDEWVVSGAFEFGHLRENDIQGKVKQAFSNGFLGLNSLGRSTFAYVSEIGEDTLSDIENSLADYFVAAYNAPDHDRALSAAREELDFIRDLCNDALINTVFTVRRYFDEEGQIREEFRTIKAPDHEPIHTPVWTITDDEA